jgi:hypothetical protein
MGREKRNRCPGAGQRARKRAPHGGDYSALGTKGQSPWRFRPQTNGGGSLLWPSRHDVEVHDIILFQWRAKLSWRGQARRKPRNFVPGFGLNDTAGAGVKPKLS